jgi:hypothetical protein
MSLFQIVSGYYNTVMQTANIITQMMGDPTILLQTAQKALIASDEALRRLLETYNVVDSDRFSLVEETSNEQTGSNSRAVGGAANLPALTNGQPGIGSPGPNIQSRVGNLPASDGAGTFTLNGNR